MKRTLPGRPRGFDEDQALDRALDIFWRNGFRSTTTRILEDGLGVGQSSLYNAFGSKRGLFEAAVDRYEAIAVAALVEPLEEAEDGLDAVARFFDALAAWVTNDGRTGCLLINLMAEDGGEDVAITNRTRAYRDRVRGALRSALVRAEDLGETSVGSAGPRSELLFGDVMGLNIIARGGAVTAEIDGVLDGVHHILDTWRLAG